jgi:PAS domain S-box-containing protein
MDLRSLVPPGSEFAALADSVSDAIIAAGPDSRIFYWNRAAERMFGWSRAEIGGELLTSLMPERYRAAHLAGIARLQETRRPQLIGSGPVELDGLHRDGHEFPIELTLGRWDAADGDAYTGVVRDITLRREGERFRTAQFAVAAALAQSSTFDAAAPGVLAGLGVALEWELGAAWLVDGESDALRPHSVWHGEAEVAPGFERLTLDMRFTRGQGLPGRAWAGRESVWIDNVLEADNFPRAHVASRAGLHAGVALPMMADGRVVGVLEFFARAVRAPDPAALELMSAVSEQVGQFIERKRAEAKVAELTLLLQTRQAGQRHAAEINKGVLHHVVQATLALDRGDIRAAQRELRATREHASRIITELEGDSEALHR